MNKNYQAASFRGIPFFVQTGTMTGGRNAVVHEYPAIDDGYVQHLSRKPKQFTIQGFLLGADCQAQADKLIAALDESGNGTLIHPWLGRVDVSLTGDYQVSWSYGDERLVMITIPFTRAKSTPPATSVLSTPAKLQSRSDEVVAQVLASVKARYAITGQPSYVATSASNILMASFVAIRKARRTAQRAYGFVKIYNNYSNKIRSLTGSASDLVTAITDLMGYGLSDIVDLSYKNLTELFELYTFGSNFTTPPATTPGMLAAAGNQRTIVDAVQLSAVALSARVVSNLTFTSYDQALSTRDTIVDKLNDLTESDIDDNVYSALHDLKAAIHTDIETRSSGLARLQTYPPLRTVPSLVLSHELYGTISRESDILERNRIANPAYVPPVPLEVLSNDE